MSEYNLKDCREEYADQPKKEKRIKFINMCNISFSNVTNPRLLIEGILGEFAFYCFEFYVGEYDGDETEKWR